MTVPEPAAPMNHFTNIELRFNDFDMLGHLNNAAFFEITDLAKARFMEWLMGEIDWRHLDVAIVNIDCTFYAQIFPDHKVGVFTGVKHIGEKSFIIEQRVINTDDKRVYAIVNSVFCAFDRRELRSKPLPPALRDALTRVMEQA